MPPELWRLQQAWNFREAGRACAEKLIADFRTARGISLPLRWTVKDKGESSRAADKREKLIRELREQKAKGPVTRSQARRRGSAPSVRIYTESDPVNGCRAIVPAVPLAEVPISAVPGVPSELPFTALPVPAPQTEMSSPKEKVTSGVVSGNSGQKVPQKRKATDGQDPGGQVKKPFG